MKKRSRWASARNAADYHSLNSEGISVPYEARLGALKLINHMSDVYDKKTRSRVMQRIRKTNTKPELLVRSVLHRMGFRFRLHRRDLPGVPDIVMPRHKTIVFVHGCFWHQHTCSLGKLPKSNRNYWVPKLRRNRRRDATNEKLLKKAGWNVVSVWECEAVSVEAVEQLLRHRLPSLVE